MDLSRYGIIAMVVVGVGLGFGRVEVFPSPKNQFH